MISLIAQWSRLLCAIGTPELRFCHFRVRCLQRYVTSRVSQTSTHFRLERDSNPRACLLKTTGSCTKRPDYIFKPEPHMR